MFVKHPRNGGYDFLGLVEVARMHADRVNPSLVSVRLELPVCHRLSRGYLDDL